MDHSGGMSMSMVFTTDYSTPFLSTSWTPTSTGSYAGTCVFFILLAISLRLLYAGRALLEQMWAVQAKTRPAVVKSKRSVSKSTDSDKDSKDDSSTTPRQADQEGRTFKFMGLRIPNIPLRLSVDLPRAAVTTLITGVAYLLMLGVMTMNVGYFLSILAGTFVGEFVVGRWAQLEDH